MVSMKAFRQNECKRCGKTFLAAGSATVCYACQSQKREVDKRGVQD